MITGNIEKYHYLYKLILFWKPLLVIAIYGYIRTIFIFPIKILNFKTYIKQCGDMKHTFLFSNIKGLTITLF